MSYSHTKELINNFFPKNKNIFDSEMPNIVHIQSKVEGFDTYIITTNMHALDSFQTMWLKKAFEPDFYKKPFTVDNLQFTGKTKELFVNGHGLDEFSNIATLKSGVKNRTMILCNNKAIFEKELDAVYTAFAESILYKLPKLAGGTDEKLRVDIASTNSVGTQQRMTSSVYGLGDVSYVKKEIDEFALNLAMDDSIEDLSDPYGQLSRSRAHSQEELDVVNQ